MLFQNSPGRAWWLAIPVLAAIHLQACEKPATPTQPARPVLANTTVASEPRNLPLNGLSVGISGFVHEQDPIPDVPIPGVTIEIIEGEFRGRSTITDSEGFFSFQGGTPSSATLKLTKPGYEERRHEIVLLRALAPFPEGRTVAIALAALPPTASLNIRIDNAGSTNAIFQYSPIRFDASSSRAVRPVYRIEFGDGESTTETVAVHPCNHRGILTSRVTVIDAFGRTATDTASFRCIALYQPPMPGADTWDNSGIIESTRCRPPSIPHDCFNGTRIRFDSQVGASVTGLYIETYYDRFRRIPFTGKLSGDRNLRIVLDDRSVELTGEVLLDDRRSEWGDEWKFRHLKLMLKGGRDDGRQLDFEYHEHDW